jgi:outer membrane protein assembly factor BamB
MASSNGEGRKQGFPMTNTRTNEPAPRKPLRLWPGAVAAALLVVVRLGVPAVFPDASILAVLGALAATAIILVWWIFFSRAPWSERLGAVVVMAAALAATRLVLHESIRGGMMGLMPIVYGMPVLSVALVAWAVAGRRLAGGPRRAAMVAAILLACGLMTLVRTGGVSGDGVADIHWRWSLTPEQRLLAQAADEPAAPAPAARPAPAPAPAAAEIPKTQPATKAVDEPAATKPAPAAPSIAETEAEWPGFRGPERDGIVRGVRIETDWAKSPPVELWRRPIGPAWSSFAVRGDFVYTQEQRGEDEVVSCYRLSTGEPVWRHRDAVRFYESNAGPGPRGTPAVRNGRVYTLGATGILNALDAGTGRVAWSRNAATDTGKEIPGWGVASSPLALDDLVIVAVAGQLVAYDAATGTQRWVGESGGGGYSSPHLATIGGVTQVLLIRGARTVGVAPADGAVLWEHTWEPSVAITQPAVLADGGVLTTLADAMGGQGMRRLAVARGPAGWTVEERWTSRGLKPYYNDIVVHEGHAFGFDGSILSCIDVNDGNRKWKGGRYGHGQLVLLADQDLLLVLSEEGELALVSATPDKYTELARTKAIEGKTWNHPVLVGDVLLVRNGEEMAAFRLPLSR